MNGISMTGNDTLQINGTVLTDFADDNCAELTFPNDIANVKTGKNGNAIYGQNQTGNQAELKLRIVRGSADDSFLNNLLAQQLANFAGFALLVGEFIKNVGNGAGAVNPDTYILSGGVFTKIPEVKTNVSGETEQSVTIYTMRFATAPRVIGQ